LPIWRMISTAWPKRSSNCAVARAID
jgi:hypothetical protein